MDSSAGPSAAAPAEPPAAPPAASPAEPPAAAPVTSPAEPPAAAPVTSPVTSPVTAAELRRLPELMVRDEHRLRRRLDGARRGQRGAAALARIADDIEQAHRRVLSRRAAVPPVSFPPELPISQRVDDLAAAIAGHQVVIVAGETGSGKTTQLPKICLRLGLGVRGLIGHTQPRRIAARAVAERVAEELGTEPGTAVGYQVRFTATGGEDSLVKIMTDGILLAEIQHDRRLLRYDTLIVDEAHERSLNIDFILGYLKQLLPSRPDLKVIITSATIDPQRFSRHFDGAPVIEVSGRSYPVEVRYRPIADPDDPGADPERDQVSAITDAVRELRAEGPGDVLVFLSGEREIRDTAEALRGLHLPDTEVLPLYARLSAAEQHRVFAPHRGRRIVLATNVAETSLTVPGIRYVVDPGTARISRYSHRRKVQRLPIEAVSQASATQRAGRCGRTSDGVCIRLFTEADFAARPAFTEPEILRTNLASVILQMTALGLGDLAAFPFIDPPDRRNVTAGVQLLQELGALDAGKGLTPMGRRLAQLPVDPRLARMVLAGGDEGCAGEVMVVAAALSIQDPRERPVEHRQAADERHARFAEPGSDFLAYLNLWRYLEERQRALSSSQFRKLCRAEYLNYLRVREWQDVYGQLRQIARTLGLPDRSTAAAGPDAEIPAPAVHRALLAGLLSHIGLQDAETRDYLGARGARFAIFPGSGLFRKPPRWVMVAELVETSRLWGRVAARIEPEWIEPLAGHLVQRSYSEPRWDARRGAVLATERVTLYGVPIVAGRDVNYGGIDPELSRELFIRHALVEGDWQTGHRFFRHNSELVEQVRAMEDRTRRRDILVDDEVLFDFYDRRVGSEVVSARHFDTWWKRAGRERPGLLDFDRELLIAPDAGEVSEHAYPDELRQDGLRLPLSYAFDPGSAADGVSVQVPLPVLNRVDAGRLSWGVPGQRAELVTALLRSLPKPLRRHFAPAPETARAVLAAMPAPPEGDPGGAVGEGGRAGGGAAAGGGGEPLLAALERELRRLTGVTVPRDAWRLDQVPEHLKLTFRVVDERQRPLAEGKDLDELRRRLHGQVRAALSAAAAGIEREGVRAWDFGPLPRTISREAAGFVVTSYPALVDEGASVAVRVLDTPAAQHAAMAAGTRRLVLLNAPSPARAVIRGLSNQAKLVLSGNPHGGVGALLDDCIACAADALVAAAGGPAWDADGFARLLAGVRPRLAASVLEVTGTIERVLAAEHDARERLSAVAAVAAVAAGPGRDLVAAALADVRAQLDALVYPGFVAATGRQRLPHLERYLRAAERRLAKLPENPRRDAELMHRVHAVDQARRELPPPVAAGEVRWMVEELRVSFFAQSLGTAYPVSEQRCYRAIDELAGSVDR